MKTAFFLILLSLCTLIHAKEHESTWLKLSIHAQNAAHKVHLQGIESDEVDAKMFKKDIEAINKELDFLVKNGVLSQATIKLKPALDIEDAVISKVRKLIDKASAEYGIYVVKEMMDIGAEQYLIGFKNPDAPITLNVRLPKALLEEFKTILRENNLH